MSGKITWTRTVACAVQCRGDRRPGPHRRLHGDGFDGVRPGRSGDRGHADRPHRRRGCRVAAAGLGRRADAGDRPAAPCGVHPQHLPDVCRCSAWSPLRSPCCSWRPLDRIPLGTASALEFLGPLGVAVAHGKGVAACSWPGLGGRRRRAADPAVERHRRSCRCRCTRLRRAVCWACYILLTQRVGDEVAGINGLAVSMPVAGVGRDVDGRPRGVRPDDPEILLIGIGLAILLPVVPFALELLALAPTHHGGVRHADEPRAGVRDARRIPVYCIRVPGVAGWSASASWSPRASVRHAPAPGPPVPLEVG